MSKPRVAMVPVASRFESGGDRWEGILNGARAALEQAGLDVQVASKMVWDAADALEVIDQLVPGEPDLLVLIHVTWVCDSIQYLFVNTLKCPLVLWAVPYIETFSLACVQHCGSILRHNGIGYRHAYGLPTDPNVIVGMKNFARAAQIARELRRARIALIGPRQTWRVANAQDMTQEEWDFSRAFGASIVHIEMSELIGLAEKQSDSAAEHALASLRERRRLGEPRIDRSRLLGAAKVYLAVKELFQRYRLTAAAAECYPQYGGLTNLPSSWLADDGVVLDTEGDIGHTFLLSAMYRMGSPGPAALSEIGSIEPAEDCVYLDHEGSSAHSLAEDLGQVVIQEAGDGTMVGFPFKVAPQVTLANLCGSHGRYQALITTGSTLKVDQDVWVNAGRKLLLKVRFRANVADVFNAMLSEGVDHHLLVKEGDITIQLKDFCDLLHVRTICI